ncbi:hypothetical protein LJC37_01705 [Bacteroidales bacterium OttesenSCG-928-E04]|nr:hypothetical protein [Bacteroidales bacterium OttesenSCG-928-E04]
MQKKIVDSSPDISAGGRADRYWSRRKTEKPISSSIHSKIPVSVKRKGGIDQYDLLKMYRLKGFEWGNWLSASDRADRLSAAAMSFRDLSIIMKSKNLGFDGILGVAFGARGQSRALAHFEPSTFMINITKERGAGSLAHEYGHAIDYFFGMYIDQNLAYSSLVGGGSLVQNLKNNKGGQLRTIANEIVNSIILYNGQVSESYKRIMESGEYWRRRNEIWARFFEQYVSFELKKYNVSNPFLSKLKYESKYYLTKKDFDRVKPMMDTFVKVVSKKMNENATSSVEVKRGKIAATNKK